MEATTQQQAPQRSLIKKLSEVMGIVDRVPKNGRNTAQNYWYATEADIAEAVRKALAERHLLLVPDVLPEHTKVIEQTTRSGGTQRIASILVKFTLHDGDSGETLVYHIPGEGQDSGDKAFYKAVTGAEKYALLKIFLIPTGDDPEKDSPKSAEGGGTSTARTEKPAPASKGGDDVVKFGPCKGKHLSEISDKDLDWYADRATESVAKHDEKWHSKNVAWRDKVMDEQERRKKAAHPSSSPSSTAPKGTPFERLVATLDGLGVPGKEYLGKLKERGKTRPKEVTEEDFEAIVAFFSGSEPPPPSDDDAPGGVQ